MASQSAGMSTECRNIRNLSMFLGSLIKVICKVLINIFFKISNIWKDILHKLKEGSYPPKCKIEIRQKKDLFYNFLESIEQKMP